MAGQLVKRGDRKWLLRWYIGERADGTRRYGSRMVTGTRRDAERALRGVLEQKDHGIVLESKGITVAAFLDKWLEDTAPKRRRAATVAHYAEMAARYIKPHIGEKRLDRLTVLDVQAMVSALEKGRPVPDRESKRKGRARKVEPLSPQTVRYANAVLSAALSQAVRWRLLQANPARDVEMPRRSSKRIMRALSPEECAKFREAAQGHRLEALFSLMMATGLRPGEVFALRWADLDLEAATLRVERALVRGTGDEPRHFDEPKTAGSKRTVPLPAGLVPLLVRHRKAQAAERLKAGELYDASGDLVFATTTGEPLDGANVRNREFRPLLRKAGLPESIRVYDLRHTAATLMLTAGGNVRAVADRLGHASAKMVLDVYAHTLQPDRDSLTESLDRALWGE